MRRALVAFLLWPTLAVADSTSLTIGGYVEAYYQLHAQDPDNRVTNLRGFDNRSRSFTLSNAALDVRGTRGPIATRIVLQFGATGASYYGAEPALPGTPTVNATSSELWRYLQTASLTATLPDEWIVEAGLLASPIGPEAFAVKDNAHWSRSNLFVGLPFYHAGATASHPLGLGWTGKLHVYNGWNSVVDRDGVPSVAASASYTGDATSGQVLYLGGIERTAGAVEGRPWRHLFDAHVTHAVTPALTVIAHGNVGFEQGDLGTSAWWTGSLHARFAVSDRVYVAARGDYFAERVPDGASSIFWPARWVSSGTATLGYQPVDGISLRLEVRHDQAASDAFFGGTVDADVPNRTAQDTATLGAVAWF